MSLNTLGSHLSPFYELEANKRGLRIAYMSSDVEALENLGSDYKDFIYWVICIPS